MTRVNSAILIRSLLAAIAFMIPVLGLIWASYVAYRVIATALVTRRPSLLGVLLVAAPIVFVAAILPIAPIWSDWMPAKFAAGLFACWAMTVWLEVLTATPKS